MTSKEKIKIIESWGFVLGYLMEGEQDRSPTIVCTRSLNNSKSKWNSGSFDETIDVIYQHVHIVVWNFMTYWLKRDEFMKYYSNNMI